MRRSDDDFDDDDEEDDDAPAHGWKRWLLYLSLAGFGLFLGVLIPYVWVLDGQVRETFGQLQWQVPTTVYAQPLKLAAGQRMDASTLLLELSASLYRNDGVGSNPGTYRSNGDRFRISSRGFNDVGGPVAAKTIDVQISERRVVSIKDLNGRSLGAATLDPARIAALYGSSQEERQLVRAADVPPLLVGGLQAVEDRDFKNHHGVDVWGIVRAMWVNAREGEMRQGGSTLTQQLVRGLFLTNERSVKRKINEALYAIIIESRFDKQTILEAYLNQVYLGQQGSQSIHGIAAASQFWFGRPLSALQTQDVALMIGLIKGPSYYDPRRYPDRAMIRRNVVIGEFLETGLINAAEAERATAAPLGISAHPGIVTNRYPAFVDLVRRQLQTDYPADSLKGAGLVIHSTLDPAAQIDAEQALQDALDKVQRKKGPPLEGGLVVTDVRDGDVLAVVGGRDVAQPGFNRALDAQRPVGSLLKPFVYLLALAQPGKYSLASVVDDAPVSVTLGNGRRWSPSNSDGRSHGSVRLIDALAQSYNQATVRVGMDVSVERVAKIIKVLAGIDADPNPSLILGAVDQTPFAMAQLYQFLASGGEVQPLHAVRGVIDAHGVLVKRYDSHAAVAQPGDALAARLVTLAMQQVVVAGTAHALQADGLGFLQAAGKTGTSNDSRDSWFAGFTGDHLAVIWVGNDQNAETGLYGATGAMRVWSGLFKKLPSASLTVGSQGMEWAWVSPMQLVSVDASCPGARHFAFVQGFAPSGPSACDAVANPTDEQGWIRVPSADDSNPELGATPAENGDQGTAHTPSDSSTQQQPSATAPVTTPDPPPEKHQ
jgi:penicillin-binding protein 1B